MSDFIETKNTSLSLGKVHNDRDISQRMDSLVEAVTVITSGLNLSETLQHIADSARSLMHCRYSALGILGADNKIEKFIISGINEEEADRIGPYPEGKGLLGLLIQSPTPVRIDDISKHPLSYGFPPKHPMMKTFLGVPIKIENRVFGNLYLTDKLNSYSQNADDMVIGFTAADERLAMALSAIAGIAIENTRLHQRAAQLILASDRERIARDLHDLIIQRLFAIGMSLQGMINVMDDDVSKERLAEVIDGLDGTIADIRKTIFSLGNKDNTFKSAFITTVEEASELLGYKPKLNLIGHIDTLIDRHLGDHILAVLKEGLSNILRHAKATEVTITLEADDEISLTIKDNGRGIKEKGANGFGLANMEERAKLLGGSFSISSLETGGSCLKWAVPANRN
ncbi:MAG: GAF domain-containing sensor histidine kinase [Firmicutes bacterium]|nr:GAF domain-containing sensor histidine kinase [Bacillota bacterium]